MTNGQQGVVAKRIAATIILVSVVIAAHFLPGLTNSIIEQEIRNATHIFGFALVAAAVFEALPGNTWKTAAISFLFVLVLGVLAEFGQQLGGRVVDFDDVYRDLYGAGVYLAARLLWQKGESVPLAKVFAVCIAFLAIAPLVFILYARSSIAGQFPVFADFENEFGYLYIIPLNSELELQAGDDRFPGLNGNVARLQLLRRNWSGLQIEPVVRDWSSYSSLVLTAQILNGTDRSQVDIHLNDGAHPGFRTQHLIGGQAVGDHPQELRYSLHNDTKIEGRPDLDLTRVERIFIIAKGRQDGAVLVIDNIRLE